MNKVMDEEVRVAGEALCEAIDSVHGKYPNPDYRHPLPILKAAVNFFQVAAEHGDSGCVAMAAVTLRTASDGALIVSKAMLEAAIEQQSEPENNENIDDEFKRLFGT